MSDQAPAEQTDQTVNPEQVAPPAGDPSLDEAIQKAAGAGTPLTPADPAAPAPAPAPAKDDPAAADAAAPAPEGDEGTPPQDEATPEQLRAQALEQLRQRSQQEDAQLLSELARAGGQAAHIAAQRAAEAQQAQQAQQTPPQPAVDEYGLPVDQAQTQPPAQTTPPPVPPQQVPPQQAPVPQIPDQQAVYQYQQYRNRVDVQAADVLGYQQDELGDLSEAFYRFANSAPDFIQVLESPTFQPDDKRYIVSMLAKAAPETLQRLDGYSPVQQHEAFRLAVEAHRAETAAPDAPSPEVKALQEAPPANTQQPAPAATAPPVGQPGARVTDNTPEVQTTDSGVVIGSAAPLFEELQKELTGQKPAAPFMG